MIDLSKLALLKGKKALVTGIANDQSIAWGCAKAFNAFGADVAVTYLNDKTKRFVDPVVKGIDPAIYMPLDVQKPGELEAVFDAVKKKWGKLDIVLHSIAFAPKEDLQGRVVDCSKDGFLMAMELSCWSFIRMAKLAEPLMKDGGTLFTMTYYGSQMVVENYNIMGPVKAALESATRYMAAELGPKGIRVHAISPGPLKTRAASGIPEFDSLLDPANGRADVLPGGAPDRYRGGFSVGAIGTPSMLFFGRYDGTFKDLSVIAHEGGHAVHRELMTKSSVSPSYAQGPHFLFESFAAFNELVLADFMAEHAATPELKRHYRERWMSIKGLDAFYGAQDALLEQAIYDGVAAGTVRNADDLDSLTLRIDGMFSQFPASTPEARIRWATVSLMYEDPLYDVNYVYGGLLALKYYHLYTTRRDWFVPRYMAMLRNGFDAPPAELLKRFLEIDLSGAGLLEDDLAILNSRLNDLEASHAEK